MRAGRRETVSGRQPLARMLSAFDWGAASRMVDGADGRLRGAVLVTSRATDEGAVARIDAVVSDAATPDLCRTLTTWGIGLARATGAAVAQVWAPRGQGEVLHEMGLVPARPFWRMDRSLLADIPPRPPVPAYRLRVGPDVPAGTWSEMHNRTFADHWRYSSRTEEELMTGRPLELALLAETENGSPAAITISWVESFPVDARPQPVGIIGSVGTLPEHRRRGLAGWLVEESLARLRAAGARHASLYVDGMNATGAPAVYRNFGFEVAFESDVWEATFP